MDAIYPYLGELKSELAMRILTEFGLRKDMVIYDLTSLCFEGGVRELGAHYLWVQQHRREG